MTPIKLNLAYLKTTSLKVLPTQGELNRLNMLFRQMDATSHLRPLTISDEDGGTVRRWYIEGAGWIVCRYDRWQLQRGNPVHGLDEEQALEYQCTMRYNVVPPREGAGLRASWLPYRESRELSQDLSALGHGRRGRAQDAQEYWSKRFIRLTQFAVRKLPVSTEALICHAR